MISVPDGKLVGRRHPRGLQRLCFAGIGRAELLDIEELEHGGLADDCQRLFGFLMPGSCTLILSVPGAGSQARPRPAC